MNKARDFELINTPPVSDIGEIREITSQLRDSSNHAENPEINELLSGGWWLLSISHPGDTCTLYVLGKPRTSKPDNPRKS